MGHQGGQGHSDIPLPHPRVPPESGDVKATVAVLSFILSSAAKHSVDGESLSSELQQLGLPKGTGMQAGGRGTCVPGVLGSRPGRVALRYALPSGNLTSPVSSLSPHRLHQGASILSPEHAASLCRCYEEKQSPLQEHLRACSLRGECGRGQGGVWAPIWKMYAAWEVLVLRKET